MASLEEIIGTRIRLFRIMKGYTIAELAYQSGLNESHLSKIERGVLNFTTESLEKTLIGLDVPYSVFFQFDDPIPLEEDPIISKTVTCMKHMNKQEKQHVYKTAMLIQKKESASE